MRGPNKVKKTAEQKAAHRAQRQAKQDAKQQEASATVNLGLGSGFDMVGDGGLEGGPGSKAQQMIANAVNAVAAETHHADPGSMELTLEGASRFDNHLHGDGKSGGGGPARHRGSGSGFMAQYGNPDSYDRGGQTSGGYDAPAFSQPSSAASGGNHYGGAGYYSPSFSRADTESKHHSPSAAAGIHGVPQPMEPQIDDRLENELHPSDEQNKNPLGNVDGPPQQRDHRTSSPHQASPGRLESPEPTGGPLAAYLMPEQQETGHSGEYSPGAAADGGASGSQW